MEKDFVQLPAKQVMLAMLGVMLAMFMAALGQTVVATAMPVIIADLGGFDRYTWAATAYLVAATVSIPIVGRLTDLYGRKVFLVLGIVVFIGGSIPAGMSQTMNQLIAFRAIQGIGGGTIMAYGFLVTADLFPPEVRGRYQGLISLVYGVASVIGPTLGGVVTDVLSWNWIFFINIPIGIPILLLIIRTFPPIRPEIQNRRLDYLGMVTLVLSVVTIMLALSIVGVHYAWDTPQVIGLLAFGLVMTAIFAIVRIEGGCSHYAFRDVQIQRGYHRDDSCISRRLRTVWNYYFFTTLFSGRSGCLAYQQRRFPDPLDTWHRCWCDRVRANARQKGWTFPTAGVD